MMVAVERRLAYRLLTAPPSEGHQGPVVSLAQLRQDPEEHLGPLRCATGLTSEEAYRQVLDLLPTMPGVPLGLTFDGGIAVTYTDFRLAEQRWARL